MSQILDFKITVARQAKPDRVVPRGNGIHDVWPDVTRHDSSEEDAAAALANSPKRVLSEVLLVLGFVGIFVLAVTVFVPGQ